MTALYEDDPSAAEAEAITRDMVAEGYVGRHGIDEQAMTDLVAARVAHLLGDRRRHDRHEQAALLRLHTQLRSWVQVHMVIRKAERRIEHDAHVQLDLMRLEQVNDLGDLWPNQCPDPDLHRRWDIQAGRTEASRMRVARGCCGWCSLPTPRRSR